VNYYNEIDPYAAQWLRNLIDAGHIARGDVDERSIVDVRSGELAGYTQCHFFAGIGGWSVALRLAGWSDDRPVWTGSCPCQPFSAAGAGKAADDERHLWPAWFSLIAECRPPIVFGEQVEAAIGWGWLDAVFADLEGEGYACGAAVLPACGVGAPHIRQRTWFVANTDGRDTSAEGLQRGGEHGQQPQNGLAMRGLGDASKHGSGSLDRQPGSRAQSPEPAGGSDFPRVLVNTAGEQVGIPGCTWQPGSPMGNADSERETASGGFSRGPITQRARSFWSEAEWIECRDGQQRPIEPGSSPLAHGIPARPSKLRAYGNAIVPQVAAEFIKAACD
jgi:DNA (cytosine-5)-methyltransferase 1